MATARILVVDDTPDLRVLYSLWLSRAGYEVLQASSGEECLELVNSESVDLVLLDVMLPDVDGIEVCKRIKSQTPSLPVINISGRLTSSENEAEGLEAGADGYLTKPFQERTLVANIKALLRIKQTEAALYTSEKRFSAAFNNALDAMLIADDHANYIDANPAACTLFGTPREEMLTRNLSDFVEPGLEREVLQLWQRFIETGELSGEFSLQRADGTRRLLEYRAKASFLPHHHFAVLRDITERKKTDEALRQAHDELENRVEQRTAELVAANTFLREEIAERKRAEAKLEERLRFETLLSELSAAFTSVTADQVDELIQNWLGRLVEFFEIDRASFCGFESSSKLHTLLSYTRDQLAPAEYTGLDERLCWITAELSPREPFRWSAASPALPRGAGKDQRYLQAMGIKSNLSIPVTIAGQTEFVLALTSIRTHREWPDEQVARLRLVGEIFANAALRAQTEKALKKSEERLRQVIQGVKDYAIYTLDKDGRIVSWNEGAKRMKGYEENEILGKHFSCFYPPEDAKAGKPELALDLAARDGRMENEGWRVRKDGSRFWANVIISAMHNADGELQGFSKVTRDITERKLGEEALKRAEEKYRSIVENAISGIFQSTPDGRFISANQALARMFGYNSPEELIEQRRNIESEHYVDPAQSAEFKRLLDENGIVKNFELQAYRKDGAKIWTSENVRSVRDQTGRVIYYEGIVEDITVGKKLEETRQLLSSIVESSSDGIVSFTVDGKVLSWNAAAEKLFGYSAQEVNGRDISQFVSSNTARESLPIFKVVKTGHPLNFETRLKRKDGTPIEVSITISPIKNQEGAVIGVSSNVRDISDARRAAEMRAQLLRRLVTAQEDERRRISRELHDQMGQSLAALMLGLKSLEGRSQLESSASHRLKSLQELTNSLAEEVHTLARHLRPTALDDFGLHTALSNYVEEWSERSEIEADFHSNGLLNQRLPADIETAVYRMVQEALTNVLKHARARNVSVIVEHRAGRVLAIVEDDGCGFEVSTPPVQSAKHRRLGVLGMEERITLVGGTLNIESTQGVGTTVLANIPVNEPVAGGK